MKVTDQRHDVFEAINKRRSENGIKYYGHPNMQNTKIDDEVAKLRDAP
jgi:hypothetical protein